MIDPELLRAFGAQEKDYQKNDPIFHAGDRALAYFQIITGEVKMNNYTEEGKEFIQGLFTDGNSFGEPPLFGKFNYPANAIALKPTRMLCLAKEKFFDLLRAHSDIHFEFTQVLANRLLYKAIMASEISSQEADHRILTLIDYFKHNLDNAEGDYNYQVPLTRQQIADLTGLRVETVIRAMKKLHERGAIKIVNRKVWR